VDQDIGAYYIHFGSTTERGVFNAGSAAFSTIEEAIAAAESLKEIGETVRWRT
jgi:hypothetical protein